MRTIGKYIRPYAWRIALQMCVKISGTVIELFLPSLLSIILDEYAPAGDKTGVWTMGCVMILLEENDMPLSEPEAKLVQTVAGFLGRQLEN